MAFVYRLEDLAGRALDELPGATAKRLGLAVGSMATAGYTLRSDHPWADFVLECDSLLAVYETDVPGLDQPLLHFHGRQVSAEEDATAGAPPSVATTYADPYWLLLRRLVGKSAAGYSRGTSLAPVDRGTIISELVDAANAEETSRVRIGTVTPSSTTYVAGWFYKKIGEAIAELGATLDGPDWRVRPIEYSAGVIGELDVAPAIGQLRPEAIFEYGDGLLNVVSYKRGVTLEGAANRLHGLPPSFPDNATQATMIEENAGSLATRELLEDFISSDLTVDELRRAILKHHLAVRGGPRQTITFEPVSDLGDRVPRFGVDYGIGDVIPFRASIDRAGAKVRRIDALMRVYGVELTDAGGGAMRPALTVTPST